VQWEFRPAGDAPERALAHLTLVGHSRVEPQRPIAPARRASKLIGGELWLHVVERC
jgi:hypothetical protein